MTPEHAWDLIQDRIDPDCGPNDEGWNSEELSEAIQVFNKLYAPHLQNHILFPNSPFLWTQSERDEKGIK